MTRAAPYSRMIWGTDRAPEIKDGLVQFVGARVAGGERGFGACIAMGVIEAGKLAAAVIFHDWNPESNIIEFTAASDSRRWLTRPVLWAMFDYAFNQAGCQAVVMRVAENNRMMNGRGIQRILKAYGFTETRINHLAGRDNALMIYTLTDKAWASNGFHSAQEAREAA